MQYLRQSYFQCWATHSIADLGRKFLLLCSRNIRCCWQDVLGEEHLFAQFPVFFLKHPLQAAVKGRMLGRVHRNAK